MIEIEPDNYMAYYNRALLRYETGDYQGSVHDFDVVLRQYPNFVAGYYSRAEVKRKMHDESVPTVTTGLPIIWSKKEERECFGKCGRFPKWQQYRYAIGRSGIKG